MIIKVIFRHVVVLSDTSVRLIGTIDLLYNLSSSLNSILQKDDSTISKSSNKYGSRCLNYNINFGAIILISLIGIWLYCRLYKVTG